MVSLRSRIARTPHINNSTLLAIYLLLAFPELFEFSVVFAPKTNLNRNHVRHQPYVSATKTIIPRPILFSGHYSSHDSPNGIRVLFNRCNNAPYSQDVWENACFVPCMSDIVPCVGSLSMHHVCFLPRVFPLKYTLQ